MKTCVVLSVFLLCSCMILLDACQSDQQLTYERYYANGRQAYAQYCQNCHAENGAGLGTLIPPLTDSALLKKNLGKLACMFKFGVKGGLVVNGKEYNGEMPPHPSLTAIDLAEIVTYITNSFGNRMGLYDVAAAQKDCAN